MVKKIISFLMTSSLETYVMVFSIIAGTLFLIAAITTEWGYYFSTFICYASAVMVAEDKPKSKAGKSKGNTTCTTGQASGNTPCATSRRSVA